MNAVDEGMGTFLAAALALSPLLTVLIAGVGVVLALRTFWLRSKIDTADQWWSRVQYAIDLCLKQGSTEQNIGTAMLDQLQGDSRLSDELTPPERRRWARGALEGWIVQKEDLLMIHAVVKELALAAAKNLQSPGMRMNPTQHREFETLMRQAQLVLKIDKKLGRDSDPEILKILTPS